ncbi:MAG: PQQ-binding-like beta-propeller repeat protein [Actinomycetia bacterium]|nr:PQQ-binding-like beta-propeller repeat protein [Actinomycetes bacterium]
MAIPPRVTAEVDPSGVRCVRFSPDSRHLWVAGAGGTTHRLDAESWSESGAVDGPVGAVNSLAFDQSGRRVALGAADGSLHAVDTRTLEVVIRIDAHDASVNSVALGPAGQLAATGGADGQVRVHDLRSGSTIHDLEAFDGSVRSVAVVDGWSTVVAAGDGPDLVAWSLGAGNRRWDLTLESACAGLRGTGGSVVTVDVEGDVRLCDASNRRERGSLRTGRSGPMAWCGSSHLLAIADRDVVGVWRYGGEHVDLDAGPAPVRSVDLSGDLRWIATGSDDGTIHIWSIGDLSV